MDAQAVQVARRTRFNPLRSLTPELLSSALDAHDIGDLRQADLLWRAIAERDDVLKGVKPKREKAVSRRSWEIVLADDSAEAKRQKETLEHFWSQATAVDAFDRNDRGGFSAVVRHLMQAQSYRYAALHLVWKPTPQGLTAEFEAVPTMFFENRTGALRWLGPQGFGIEGSPLDPTNWLVCAGEGLMKPCSIAYTFKALSYSDWIAFNEKFGMGFVKGTTNAPKDSAEWDAMVEAVETFMNDRGAVFSEGSSIDVVAQGNAGNIPFPALMERADRAMTALYLGSDLASMSRGGSANSGASVQGGEGVKIEADDCAWVSEQLQRVDRLVLDAVHGAGTPALASVQVRGPVTRDITRDLAIDEKLIAWGVPVSLSDLAERYERSLPDDGEPLAGAKPAPAANELQADSLRDAVKADLQPAYDALAKALQGDLSKLPARLKKLNREWPAITDAVLAGDSLEQAMEKRLGEAFVEGLDLRAAAANAFNPLQARDLRGRWVDSAETLGGTPGKKKASESWHHDLKVLQDNRDELQRQVDASDLEVRKLDEEYAKWMAVDESLDEFDLDDEDTWPAGPDSEAATASMHRWREAEAGTPEEEAALQELEKWQDKLSTEHDADAKVVQKHIDRLHGQVEKARTKNEKLRESLQSVLSELEDDVRATGGDYSRAYDPLSNTKQP